MKKQLLTCFTLLTIVFCQSLKAQTNSIELKDNSGTLISSHSNIQAAINSIPLSLTQAYIIEITSTYTGASETYPITFGLRSGASSTNTITLRPALGVTNAVISSSQTLIMNIDDADYIRIDGRAGGQGNANNLTITNTLTTSTNTLQFINGACFNIVRNINISHGSSSSAGRAIYFNTSASNVSGNSNNEILNCNVTGGRYRINAGGTAANPNNNIKIKGCTINNINFAGIWQQAGTANITIDSCQFQNTSATGDGGYFILFDGQRDTAIVRNCTFKDLQNSSTSANSPSIYLRSVNATSNVSRFYNNFISYTSGNANSTNLTGIQIEGTGPINSEIYNNTIHMGGTLGSGGTSGNVVSSCIRITSSNASNQIKLKNNILVNSRTGGTAGTQHLAVVYTNSTTPVISDYNTYNSASGDIARINTTVYSTLAAYQAAVPAGNEANSNTEPVQFVSPSDLHLTGSSISNTNLQGDAVAYITTDIDNAFRGIPPYRGADESLPFQVGCSGIPYPGIVQISPSIICAGDNITATLTNISPLTLPDLSLQWLISTNGTTYTPIAGATSTSYSTIVNQQSWFKVSVQCTTSGLYDTTTAVIATITPKPTAQGITETHIDNVYNFSVNTPTNATSYSWNFGDGTNGSGLTTTKIYSTAGNFNVSVIVANTCGDTTLTLPITVGCDGSPAVAIAAASVQSVCPGQNASLILQNINSVIASTLTFQWQSSTDGINFTDIAGATSPSYTTTINATLTYRCIVTCTSSGLFTPSSAVTISVIPLPTVGGINISNNGMAYTFTGTGLSNQTSVFWNLGNGVTATSNSPTYTYPQGGTYNVYLVAINSCGTDTFFQTIQVGCTTAPPQTQIDVLTPVLCSGNNISMQLLGILPNEIGFYTYQWQSSSDGVNFNNIAGATNPSLNIPVGTDTLFRCLVQCGALTTASANASIIIGSTPTGGTISETHNGLTYNFSLTGLTGNYTYLWNFGDGNTSTLAAPTHTYAQAGNYNVTVQIISSCGSVTRMLFISPTIGLNNLDDVQSINVYPNPTSDILYITSSSIQDLDQIKIVDAQGKVLWIQQGTLNFPFSISINELGLKPGTYWVDLKQNNLNKRITFIVK